MTLQELSARLSDQMQDILELMKGYEAQALSMLSREEGIGDSSRLQGMDLALQAVNDCKSILMALSKNVPDDVIVDASLISDTVKLEKFRAELGCVQRRDFQSEESDAFKLGVEFFEEFSK
jgi:hypothetical protein